MADVYYRVSGRPTATFTSCGPGSAQPADLARQRLSRFGAVPGGDRQRADQPVQPRRLPGNVPAAIRPTSPRPCAAICKKVFQPTRGEMVPLAVRQAWKTMVTGRPGPVVLDVPFDVFMEAAAEEAPNAQAWNANISSRCGADPEGVVKAVDMLLGAERPVILVGQGVRYGGAAEELLKLAERLQIPVAASDERPRRDRYATIRWRWASSRAPAHYQANHATRQADVLLALGVRFDDRTSSSWIPGYSFTIPPTQADPCRHRSGGDRPQLSGRARPDGRRAHLPAAGAGRTRSPRRSRPRRPTPARNGSRRSTAIARNGTSSSRPASPTTPRRSIRSAPRSRSTRRCPRMRSSSATSACITTGCSASASRSGRIR